MRRALCALVSFLFMPVAHAGSGSVNQDGTIDITVNLRFPPSPQDLEDVEDEVIDASRVLWDATEGQLRFGRVTIDCGAVDEDLADIWMKPGRGRAGVSFRTDGSSLGQQGAHIDQFLQSSSAIVFAHEFGHFALGLGDEYSEQSRFGNCWGVGPCFDGGTDEQNHCLMEQSAGTSQTELCVASNHDMTVGEGTPCTTGANAAPCTANCRLYSPTTGAYETTQQQDLSGTDCWTHITNNFGFLTPPEGLPEADAPSGFVGPTFVDDCEATDTALLVLDRSGSMAWGRQDDDEEVCGNSRDDDADGTTDESDCSASRLSFLQGAARAWLSLANGQGVRAGIVSFDDTAATEVGFREVDASSLGTFQAAVDGLSPGGTTAIGRALGATTLLFGGESGALNKTAFLISDGRNTEGESPGAVIGDLEDEGIRVMSISTGAASDDATLTSISSATGGQRVDARDAATLVNAFVRQWAHYRNEPILVPEHPWVVNPVNTAEQLDDGLDLTAWQDGTADAIDVSDTTVRGDLFELPVPPDAETLTLVFAAERGDLSGFGLEAELTDPSGNTLDTESGATSLEVVRDRAFFLVEVVSPPVGEWQVELRPAAGADAYQTGHLTAFAEAPRVDLFPSLDRAWVGPSSPVGMNLVAKLDTPLRDLGTASVRVRRPSGVFDPVPVSSTRAMGGGDGPRGTYVTPQARGLYEARFAAITDAGTTNDPGEAIWAPEPVNTVPVPSMALQASRSFYVVEGEPACVTGNPDDCDGDCLVDESELDDADQDFLPDPYDSDSDNDEIPDGIESRGCQPVDSDEDGVPDHQDPDSDDDDVPDTTDLCRTVPDPAQLDADDDGLGDACDPCPDDPRNDDDGDGVCFEEDVCPDIADPEQVDADGDGAGDACDPCPEDADDDADGDGICAPDDVCPDVADPEQADADGDGLGDACDPEDDADDDPGCDEGCASAPRGSGALLVLLSLAAARRRRAA